MLKKGLCELESDFGDFSSSKKGTDCWILKSNSENTQHVNAGGSYPLFILLLHFFLLCWPHGDAPFLCAPLKESSRLCSMSLNSHNH
jgi:hypothetical protein